MAMAMATRCAMPPESSWGKFRSIPLPVAQSNPGQQSEYAVVRCLRSYGSSQLPPDGMVGSSAAMGFWKM